MLSAVRSRLSAIPFSRKWMAGNLVGVRRLAAHAPDCMGELDAENGVKQPSSCRGYSSLSSLKTTVLVLILRVGGAWVVGLQGASAA